MTNQGEEDGADHAARAFQDLQAEVLMMRRLIERLLYEWEDKRAPDYSLDLGAMRKALIAMEQRLGVIESKPALKETLETYAIRIEDAGQSVFREPKREFGEAIKEAKKTGQELAGLIGHLRGKREQRKRLWKIGSVAFGFALILGMVGAPFLAKYLPFGWDGTVASIVMGQPDRWDTGAKLMRQSQPSISNSLSVDWNLISGNKANATAIASCETEAAKSHQAQECRIVVPARK